MPLNVSANFDIVICRRPQIALLAAEGNATTGRE